MVVELLIALVITLVEVAAFAYACVLALAAVVNLYFKFIESKLYEEFVILVKELNGDVDAIEISKNPDGSYTKNKKTTIPQKDTPDKINKKLDEALSNGSTIKGRGAAKLKVTKELQDELNKRSR